MTFAMPADAQQQRTAPNVTTPAIGAATLKNGQDKQIGNVAFVETPNGMLIQVRVDSGSGISRGIMEKMFDPFFTTKDVGRGTGLGLSVVEGIAKEHRGWVTADSQRGQGSRFEIFLPLRRGDGSEMPKFERRRSWYS